jgi:hypothetical protein
MNGFDMVYVSKIIMAKLYLDEYTENTNFTKTQRSIEAISDHLRMTFLRQKYAYSSPFKVKHNKQSDKVDKSSEPLTQSKSANFRRAFPNLKTKVTFPLFAPYLLIKLLYIAIVLFNFVFLSTVFQFNYHDYGVYMIKRYLQSGGLFSSVSFFYESNDYFPKNSMCDINLITKHGYIHHSVVCALPINLFNESFYLIYWFWLIFLLVVTVVSMLHWMLLYSTAYRRRLITHALQLDPGQNISRSYTAAVYLGAETNYQKADAFVHEKTGLSLRENLELFVRDVCSADVVFTLNMLALNSNRLAMRDLVNNLWHHYLNLEDAEPRDLRQRPVLEIKRPERCVDGGEVKKPAPLAFYEDSLDA